MVESGTGKCVKGEKMILKGLLILSVPAIIFALTRGEDSE